MSLFEELSLAMGSMSSELRAAATVSMTKRGFASPNRLLDPDPTWMLRQDIESLRCIFADVREHFSPQRGRPQSQPAAAVTKMAALVFTELTGKPATPGYNAYTEQRSCFERFLAEIFAALGIEASTERQARSLRDKKKKK